MTNVRCVSFDLKTDVDEHLSLTSSAAIDSRCSFCITAVSGRVRTPSRSNGGGGGVLIKPPPCMLGMSLRTLIRNISFAFQEQELYQKEGLGVNEVHYVDNQDCIGMKAPPCLCCRVRRVPPQRRSACFCGLMFFLPVWRTECAEAAGRKDDQKA